jgi:hypothetical protein
MKLANQAGGGELATCRQHPAGDPSTPARRWRHAAATDEPYSLCGKPSAGFSLLEVMIAMFVFFIVVFAVLGMVVQSLGAARALQRQQADCGLVASMFSLSNTLEEGYYSGDFEGIVPNYAWEAEIPEPPGSNGLYVIHIRVYRTDSGKNDRGETLSMLKFTGQRSKGPGGLPR